MTSPVSIQTGPQSPQGNARTTRLRPERRRAPARAAYVLNVKLDPLPTSRATAAIAQLCEHLTATQTRYPGTNLTLRDEIKTRP